MGSNCPPILSLRAFVDEHAEDLEADLLSVFGLDILDLGTDRLSWGRLQRLIDHLPRDSWTTRAVGGEATRWSDAEHLLAAVVDVVAQGNWMFASVHSKRIPERPKALRRPGEPDQARLGGKRVFPVAEIEEVLARARARAAKEVTDGGN